MLFVTQLVYVHPGKESVFEQFEAVALPLLAKHGGELLLRLRPNPDTVVARSIEVPYEVHFVRFPSDDAYRRFADDGERRRLLPLKEESVRSSLIVEGHCDG